MAETEGGGAVFSGARASSPHEQWWDGGGACAAGLRRSGRCGSPAERPLRAFGGSSTAGLRPGRAGSPRTRNNRLLDAGGFHAPEVLATGGDSARGVCRESRSRTSSRERGRPTRLNQCGPAAHLRAGRPRSQGNPLRSGESFHATGWSIRRWAFGGREGPRHRACGSGHGGSTEAKRPSGVNPRRAAGRCRAHARLGTGPGWRAGRTRCRGPEALDPRSSRGRFGT